VLNRPRRSQGRGTTEPRCLGALLLCVCLVTGLASCGGKPARETGRTAVTSADKSLTDPPSMAGWESKGSGRVAGVDWFYYEQNRSDGLICRALATEPPLSTETIVDANAGIRAPDVYGCSERASRGSELRRLIPIVSAKTLDGSFWVFGAEVEPDIRRVTLTFNGGSSSHEIDVRDGLIIYISNQALEGPNRIELLGSEESFECAPQLGVPPGTSWMCR
jgi:hypothetical protein